MSHEQDNNIKEASSLIIVVPEARKKAALKWNPNAYSMEIEDKPPENLMNYKLLMTKRSNKSSFLASAYVFPGGHIDLADFKLDWLNFYARFKLLPYIDKLCHRNQQLEKPRILTKPLILSNSKLDDYLKPDIALRIAAIRETFEETGVLIAFNGEFVSDYRYELGTIGYSYSNEFLNNRNADYIEELSKRPEMLTWREKIKKDANKFYQFCVHYDLIPNIFQLHEWWNWQTPVTLGHKLFDTILYVTFLPKKVNSSIDNSEVSKIEWLTPEEMLKEHLNERIFIAPPQIYEVSRLANFRDYASLLDFSIKREKYGIQRWSYQIMGQCDGALLALPGDELYLDGTDKEKSSESSNLTLSDLRINAKRLNRIELKVPIAVAYCNIKLPHGQVSPITFDKNSDKSKL